MASREPIFADFDAAVRDFEAAATSMREQLDRVRARIAAAETAADLLAFGRVLREVYRRTADAIDTETAAVAEAMGSIEHVFDARRIQRVSEIHAANWPGPFIREMLASYKAWFYFARIYQDMLYGAVRRTLPGTTGSPTMNSALKPSNPVGIVLREELDGYLEWFSVFRGLRNVLKDGIPAHTRGAEGPDLLVDYGLGVTDREGVLHTIRLRDLAVALRWSGECADVAARRLTQL